MFAVPILLIGCTSKNDAISQAERTEKDRPSIEQTKAIAEEGFIYGLPIVMNYAVMYEYAVDTKSSQFKAPFNQIKNEPRVFTYKDTAIITPNSDTPYSLAWLDLRAEPMVLSVPSVPKNRYYAVMLCDTAIPTTLATSATAPRGTTWATILWSARTGRARRPQGSRKSFPRRLPSRSPPIGPSSSMPKTCRTWRKCRRDTRCSRFPQKIDFLPATTEGIKTNFFDYLDAALQFIPQSPEDKDVRARLASIGIGPGKTFDFKALSLEHKAAVLLGMKEGDDKVTKFMASGVKNINGWSIGSFFGDRAFYNGNWLMRAAAAEGGIYGNDAVEATYPLTRTDASGQELDGSKHNYTLTFPAGQFPPVNAFWSVTMYDGKNQLMIKHPIDRYLINSPMLPGMKKNEDGSLTLYIQKDSPGKAKESNWLPAPNDTIYLVMRLYWPKETPPSILPAGDGTWKPPAIQVQ